MSNKEELHLFILWENSHSHVEKIVSDICENFILLNRYEILWDEDTFSNNMTRFYGQKLPNNSFKEQECGKGRFTLVTVVDQSPVYADKATSKGVIFVNRKMFEAKERYRTWTGGGHKIHSTNSIEESKHDLYLLLDNTYENYFKKYYTNFENHQRIKLDRNIVGAIQWNTMESLFDMLNYHVEYVVLRNFESLPSNYQSDIHGDIDILIRGDHQEVAHLLNAQIVYKSESRVHYKINVANKSIRMDIRFCGDGYYDTNWEDNILETRVWDNGKFIPNQENYKYSLLYHAIVHKKTISPDYILTLEALDLLKKNFVLELDNFMNNNNYIYSEPYDLSVFFNTLLIKKDVSLRRKFNIKKALVKSMIGGAIPEKLKNRVQRFVNK